jgi:hypothetical protein
MTRRPPQALVRPQAIQESHAINERHLEIQNDRLGLMQLGFAQRDVGGMRDEGPVPGAGQRLRKPLRPAVRARLVSAPRVSSSRADSA